MSNRADRRRMMREQTAKGQQLLASYTKQQRIDALMQQGISPQQLKANYDLGFKNGYHDGYCCGTLTMRKTIYAAMSLALHELHGFGEERLIRVLKLVDEKMVYNPFQGTATISEIAANKLCGTPNIQTFAINGKSSFTFTNAGEQLDFILDVTYGDAEATGISDLLAVPTVARTQKARKYFENGRLVIETANGTFTVSGARIK